MDEREIKRTQSIEQAMDKLFSAFIDCTLHAQEALELRRYIIQLEQAARRTTPYRDTLVEEIADTIDHMGEGRRLEEYVEAIRTFKSAPSRALDRLAENARDLGLDYMTAPTAASREEGNG
ncbi:hypothetical protein WK62_05395 [Burkholderia ubonensis]|uniref:hypothetical protein n=1 Tax=Burkholderia ubonensis TaxID=101571 RepID=UPI000752C2ED|nr:hypothetical protein [Burkholderia ubonensis]KVU10697.1 hypothetical protein WK62_05395 [Burkholderia ubonensis]